MWAITLWQFGLWPLQWGVVLGASLTAAFTDLRDRRIPNWLTIPVWLGGLIAATMMAGLPGLADSIAASLLLALPYVLLFVFANGGGGDAKLMAAVGAWLGLINGLVTLVCVSLAGVVLAVMWIIRHQRGEKCGETTGDEQAGGGLAVPYGVAILAGVMVAGIALLSWRAI